MEVVINGQNELPILNEDELLKHLAFKREVKELEEKELIHIRHMYESKRRSGESLTKLETLWIDILEEAILDLEARNKWVLEVLSR